MELSSPTLSCTFLEEEASPLPGRLWGALRTLLLYATLWGCLCDMAALGALPLLPLLTGGIPCLLLPLLPDRPRRRVALALAVGSLLVLLFLWGTWGDGVKYALNRLLAASEARQSYLYERFSLTAPEGQWPALLRSALLILGLAAGGLLSLPGKGISLLAFGGLCGVEAYLGLSPTFGWCALLTVGILLTLLERWESSLPWLAVGALALVWGLTLTLFPGESLPLSTWEEGARDRLALQTVAYGELPQATPTPPPPEEDHSQFFQEEDTAGALGGFQLTWTRPMKAGLAIALFALLLFLPALLSDRARRRREANLRALDHPDSAQATRNAFLYALRWLRLGGLDLPNGPYSHLTGPISDRFSPELAGQFQALLPLWQEAAYSAHPIPSEGRQAMRAFADAAKGAAWEKLGRWERFKATYITPL